LIHRVILNSIQNLKRYKYFFISSHLLRNTVRRFHVKCSFTLITQHNISCFILSLISTIFVFSFSAYSQELSGKDLFIENRCANCHTIGKGRFVGPDLYGVHKNYTKEELITWMMNSQDIYTSKGKSPINEGYPPMPPMNVNPDHAIKIYEYLKDFKISEDFTKLGQIYGVVTNETSKIKEKALKVKLTSYLGDISQEEFTSITNSDGGYSFTNLRWDRSYVISLVFKGVEYATGKSIFKPEEYKKIFNLPVYDTTTDDSLIIIDSSHMILQLNGDKVSIAELSVIQNGSNAVYIGKNTINGNLRETLKFSLPQKASAIQFHHGLNEQSSIRKNSNLISTSSVQPGITRYVFSYEIPLERRTEIKKSINYLTNSQLILVSVNEYKVNLQGLEGGESVEMKNNQKFFKWSGNDLKKGHDIKIIISKPIFGDDITKWLILLGVILIIIGSISYSVLYKGKKEVSDFDLEDKREVLIKEIAELDDRFEAREIKEEEYKKLRDEKKSKLLEISNKIISK